VLQDDCANLLTECDQEECLELEKFLLVAFQVYDNLIPELIDQNRGMEEMSAFAYCIT